MPMRAIAVCLFVTCPCPLAAAAATAPATTRPATMPVARVPDVLTGAVDPYEPGAERGRFFRAAGVDNELDPKEFAAAQGQAGSFVRRFDRWKQMLPFDKNRNATLDWFEADAYRQALRKRILRIFDANKDGRLTGKERDRANAALAAGRVPLAAARPGAREPGQSDREWMRQRMLRQRQVLRDRHDTNKDGRIDEAERRGLLAAVRGEAQAQLAQRRLRRWDADGDGRLSESESAAMEAALAEGRRRAEAWRHRQDLARWDADGDGQLDERETAAMEADRAQQQQRGRAWRDEWEKRQYDLDGNGRLDDDERLLADAERARREAYAREDRDGPGPRDDRRAKWQATLATWRLRHFDLDGDGEIGPEEDAAAKKFGKQLRDVGTKFRNRMADRDGDGKVSDEERAASRQEWGKARWKIFAKGFRYMDADGDGQISLEERQGFQRRMQTRAVRWVERFTGRFDANRDGRLGPDERGALIEGIHKDFDARWRRFDADKDGRLSPDEAIRMMEDFVQKELGIRPSPPQEPAPEKAP